MNTDFYRIVADENLICDFLKDIGVEELSDLQSFLVQTSFRTKRLSELEREKLKKMAKDSFLIKVLRKNRSGEFSYTEALRKIYELEIRKRACTYHVGTPEEISFPQEALVTYIMSNPSNELDVAAQHARNVFDDLQMICAANMHVDQLKEKLSRTNKDFRAERATCIDSKFVNFDIDFNEGTGHQFISIARNLKQNLYTFQTELKSIFTTDADTKVLLIICHGGFHLLVPKETIKENPTNICKKILELLAKYEKYATVEYKGTKSYVPLPGTYQYGVDETRIVKYLKL